MKHCLFARRQAQPEHDSDPHEPVPTVTRLRCGIAAFFDFIDEHDLAFRLLHQESAAAVSTERDVERIRAQQSAVIVDFLRRSPGLAGVPDVLVEGYAEVVVGACERVAVWRTHREGVTADDATDLVVSAVWTGLRSLTAATTSAGTA